MKSNSHQENKKYFYLLVQSCRKKESYRDCIEDKNEK